MTDNKIRLLIADDSNTSRMTIKTFLEDEDDHIEIVGEAVNGEQAVELSAKLRPDVILMDIRMPEMDGIEATRIINGDNDRIKIIGISSLGSDSKRKKMLEAGAASFMFKEKFNIEKLIEEIKTAKFF